MSTEAIIFFYLKISETQLYCDPVILNCIETILYLENQTIGILENFYLGLFVLKILYEMMTSRRHFFNWKSIHKHSSSPA